MSDKANEIARASYERCLQRPEFPRFYERFLESCPEAAPMFAHTDIEKQEKRLRHAIGALLTYPTQADWETNVLTRIAERHSKRDLDVDPSFYEAFVESIVLTVAEFDPEFTADIGRAWYTAMESGIEYMKSMYDRPPKE